MEFMISLVSKDVSAIDYCSLDSMALRNNLLRSIGESARWEIVCARVIKEDTQE